MCLPLDLEDKPGDDAEASERSSSSSREKEGTTWGGEAGGAVAGDAGGGAGYAIYKGMATKGYNGVKQRVEERNSKTYAEKEVKTKATGPGDIYRVDH